MTPEMARKEIGMTLAAPDEARKESPCCFAERNLRRFAFA
jgi:hypothetical protein